MSAGSIIGTGENLMRCNLNSSVLRTSAAGFIVRDETGAVALSSTFPRPEPARALANTNPRRQPARTTSMKRGDTCPDFTLPDDTGTPRTLSEFLATGPVVLFFYPAALSGGCTQESCHFRDLAGEFREFGAHRIGISPDAVSKQSEFSRAHGFDYPLLSDVDGAVAKQFGAWRRFLPLHTRRRTFVIDTDRQILEVIKSELKFDAHADQALAVLQEQAAGRR